MKDIEGDQVMKLAEVAKLFCEELNSALVPTAGLLREA